jgi:2-polyprenyl-6-methoxyphenol hydroxylase-like FAD-dependent oxidoreductase
MFIIASIKGDDFMAHVEEKTPVLVVGGGLVGLSMSLFLSWHDVPHVLVERHESTSVYPKARGLHIRTMEMFRSIGLGTQIKESAFEPDPEAGIIIVDTLAGSELNRMGTPSPIYDSKKYSPEPIPFLIDQDRLERLLCEEAIKRGGDLRFGHQFLSLEENEGGNTAIVEERETGKMKRIHANFVIATDGVHSTAREILGIEQSGHGVIAHNLSIHFQADLTEELRGRNFFLCFTANPQAQGLLIPTDFPERWVFSLTYQPKNGEKAEDFTNEYCSQLVRTAVGRPDLPLENIHPMTWKASDFVAERFQEGRVFLAGDSAHQMTPAGAFGANTGIQDAHNLAWKLAYVLRGKASNTLLDSYHAERHPVATEISKESRIRYFAHQGMESKERPTLADDDAVMFGYRYSSNAIVGESHSSILPSKLELNGDPGTRIPHIWLEKNGEQVSTIDLCHRYFVLFVGSEGTSWNSIVDRVSEQLSLKVDVCLLDSEKEDSFGIESSGAVLVRPDGYVGWRCEKRDQGVEDTLLQSLTQILHDA